MCKGFLSLIDAIKVKCFLTPLLKEKKNKFIGYKYLLNYSRKRFKILHSKTHVCPA
jgi:uncharacterized UPF0146 family protein